MKESFTHIPQKYKTMDALTLYAVKENLMIRISSNNLIKDMCIRVLSIPLFDDGAFSFIHATSEFT